MPAPARAATTPAWRRRWRRAPTWTRGWSAGRSPTGERVREPARGGRLTRRRGPGVRTVEDEVQRLAHAADLIAGVKSPAAAVLRCCTSTRPRAVRHGVRGHAGRDRG